MAGWEKSRDTIGQNRTWILGRAAAGIYFLTIGLLLLAVGLVLALVFAVVDAIYVLILNRPLNLCRTTFQMLFMHQIKLAGYVLGMNSYPGIIPRRESGQR